MIALQRKHTVVGYSLGHGSNVTFGSQQDINITVHMCGRTKSYLYEWKVTKTMKSQDLATSFKEVFLGPRNLPLSPASSIFLCLQKLQAFNTWGTQ